MVSYPIIDPAIVKLGPLQIRWYGLMYVLGFVASYLLVQYQIKKKHDLQLAAQVENLNFTLMISLILGGRLGYVLLYNLPYYLEYPSEILATWQGGMSFHGALLGVIIGGVWFCLRKGLDFWRTADIYVVTIPIGLGLGRIGNFINAELYGMESDLPWAMIFPGGGPNPRHPSQLYEFFFEGVLLFVFLWKAKDRNLPSGSMLSLFLIAYGVFRTLVENFRQPDVQVGFIGMFTLGQLLSLAMISAGIMLFFFRRKQA